MMAPTVEKKNEFVLDAAGVRLGRLATRAAVILMGKQTPGYARNRVSPISLTITNASRVDIPLRKREKEYVRHSGYPGGQKFETLAKLSARRGYGEIVRRAIYGMLPKNKLRVRMMHELTITE